MPASRIAFALADFISEVKRLLPKDDKLSVSVRLDSAAFDAVIYQLAEYGGIPRQPNINEVTFGGVVIERIAPPAPFDLEKHLAGRVDQREG